MTMQPYRFGGDQLSLLGGRISEASTVVISFATLLTERATMFSLKVQDRVVFPILLLQNGV